MWDASQPVKVRVAPSPTGEPHVGTAYIGLFNLAFAKQNNGSFILRIEDTDQERSTKESEQSIIESLAWLNLNPDEGPEQGGPSGPYRQSERTKMYVDHAEKLINEGRAYRCFCTRERMDALRAEQKKEGKRLGYDGHCRELPQEEIDKHLADGTTYVVRLKMPSDGETVVKDLLRGDVKYQNELIDDQILLKSDGFPTYHLANVVDDHLMGVTHVMRAEEWIPSTPKHVVLYEAFGWIPPTFIHMPLLRNPDKGKTKISKRKNPVSLLYYKKRGFMPEALLNYLSLMGWSFPGEEDKEIFSLQEFLDNFDVTRVSLGGPVFDLAKLEWMNGQYIRSLSDKELEKRLVTHYEGDEFWNKENIGPLVPLIKERMTVLGEFDYLSQFFHGTIFIEAIAESLDSADALGQLRQLFQNLRQAMEKGAPYWNRTELQKVVSKFDDKQKKTALMLYGGKDDAELAENLFMRGKPFALKMCNEAADTLKKLKPKKKEPKEVASILRQLTDKFADVEWKAEPLEAFLKAFAEEKEWRIGDLFMPIRIGCFGRSASPGLFETMEVVGCERCQDRLRKLADILDKFA